MRTILRVGRRARSGGEGSRRFVIFHGYGSRSQGLSVVQ